MYRVAIALRYLRKHRITAFPVAGIAIGVMALVVVLSIMKGYDAELRKNFRGISPDIAVTFPDVDGFQPASRGKLDALISRLEAIPEVAAVSPYVSGNAMITLKPSAGRDRPEWGYVMYKGVEFERADRATGLSTLLAPGSDGLAEGTYGKADSENALLVPANVFDEPYDTEYNKSIPKLVLGDVVTLSTVLADWTPISTAGHVAGLVTDNRAFHRIAYMPLDWARAFGRMSPDTITGIDIRLRAYDTAAAAKAKRSISEALSAYTVPGTYKIASWEDDAQLWITILSMERAIMATIMFFFLVLAGFSIAAILILIVLDKVRDIGVLQAMGSSPRGMGQIFLAYGLAIGSAGSAIGLAAGVAIVKNIDLLEPAIRKVTGLNMPVGPVNMVEGPQKIPVALDWGAVAYIVVAALAVSFAAALLPAIRAARMDPVEAIRHE